MNFDVETINKLLASDNFKERLAGELLELTIRIQNLEQFLNNYKADKLPFKPATPYELLYEQFVYMKNYHAVLVQRLQIEEVDLAKWANNTDEDKDKTTETEEK